MESPADSWRRPILVLPAVVLAVLSAGSAFAQVTALSASNVGQQQFTLTWSTSGYRGTGMEVKITPRGSSTSYYLWRLSGGTVTVNAQSTFCSSPAQESGSCSSVSAVQPIQPYTTYSVGVRAGFRVIDHATFQWIPSAYRYVTVSTKAAGTYSFSRDGNSLRIGVTPVWPSGPSVFKIGPLSEDREGACGGVSLASSSEVPSGAYPGSITVAAGQSSGSAPLRLKFFSRSPPARKCLLLVATEGGYRPSPSERFVQQGGSSVPLFPSYSSSAYVVFGDRNTGQPYEAHVRENASVRTLRVPLTVALPPASSTPVSVRVVPGGTSAQNPADYTSISPTSFTFTPGGSQTQYLTVALATDDSIADGNKRIELEVTSAGDYSLRGSHRAILTIVDNEGPPGAPSGLTATPGQSSLNLSWTAPTASDYPATGYDVSV